MTLTREPQSPNASTALTPEDHPLLAEAVVVPASGPLSSTSALLSRIREYRARGLTEAEALTWALAHDLGLAHREVARVRGVSRRTSEGTLSRARAKLASGSLDVA